MELYPRQFGGLRTVCMHRTTEPAPSGPSSLNEHLNRCAIVIMPEQDDSAHQENKLVAVFFLTNPEGDYRREQLTPAFVPLKHIQDERLFDRRQKIRAA